MEVKINFSPRRIKTINARMIGDIMYVNAPAGMPQEQLQKIIDRFKKRFEKRKLVQELNKTPEILKEETNRLNNQ